MTPPAKTLRPSAFVLNRTIWLILAVLAVICGIWLAAEHMSLDVSGIRVFFYIYGFFLALSLFYRFVRRDDTIYLFGQIATQWLTAAALLGVLSYVSARLNLPLTDKTWIAVDHALGFDWRAYIAWIDHYPFLTFLSSAAYISSGPQMMAIVVVLFLYKKIAHMQRFLLAFLFTGVVTIFFAALFPAVAGYVHYNIDLSQYHNLHPIAARIHEAPYLAMRNHTTDVLTFPMQGIITFPSFHSALAIVLIYASLPVRWLHAIAIPLNILVLFATPVDGGHWLIDVLGGVAIAFAVIYFIDKRFRQRAGEPI